MERQNVSLENIFISARIAPSWVSWPHTLGLFPQLTVPLLRLSVFSFLICLYVILILLYVYDAREVVGVHGKFKGQHAWVDFLFTPCRFPGMERRPLGLTALLFPLSSEELLLGNLAFVFVYLDQFSKENRMGCPFCGDMLSQEI